MKQVVETNTRFAPSPSGYLHLGNIRTALFNRLLAYRYHSKFLLRIEDTDSLRSSAEFVKAIQEDLKWLGLFEDSERNEKLYFQSKRYPIYQHYYCQLEAKGAAYSCFCTEERLEQLRQAQRTHHLPLGYDGHCRRLSAQAVAYRKARGEKPSLRFQVPKGQTLIFEDLVKGTQRIESEHLRDFIIQRSDGHPAFLYCNVLDDALMGITRVLRGEDHLSNTAKQCLILQALGLNSPEYGHLPLICHQTSNTPLSKRDNSFSLQSLRAQGYLPQAILNYLARLGHTIFSDKLMSLEELSQVFSIQHIHANAAHFDKAQLDFWQKQAVHAQSPAEFWDLLSSASKDKVPYEKKGSFLEVIKPMIVLPLEAEAWVDRLFEEPLEYLPEAKAAIQLADPKLWSQLIDLFSHQESTVSEVLLLEAIRSYFKMFGKVQQRIYWKALRAALTNHLSGPDMLSLIHLLGIPKIIQRLQQAAIVA